jgi:hypothetical protein
VGNLGSAMLGFQRYDETVSAQQNAIAIFRETGDRPRQAQALGQIGFTFRMMQRHTEAVRALRSAADLSSQTGDRHGEALSLMNLSLTLSDAGQYELRITRDGDTAGDGNVLFVGHACRTSPASRGT